MFMRAVIVRIVYVGIVSVGILVSAALRQSTVEAAPMGPLPAAARHAGLVATTLPTVTLATIRVRARSAAPLPSTARAEIVVDATASAGNAPVISVHTLRLDMPFYSFGRMLPRVGKD